MYIVVVTRIDVNGKRGDMNKQLTTYRQIHFLKFATRFNGGYVP
jgi:hypothetical protein